ncbi:MAG: ankyrin repeat domain-containing protein [Phycisphaerales bacterium]|nr:MAG: ankyrin repeat domain-containing protein [Phycisphaerales bacterium]
MDATQQAVSAVKQGDAEALRGLVTQQPGLATSVGDGGLSVLITACYYQRRDLVALLLEHAPPLPLFEAAAVNRAERVRELLDAGGDADARAADGMYALHLAAFFNAADAVRVLLEGGANVNRVADNPMKVRPIHSAVAGGSAAIVEMLIRHGADVNARQQEGWTPLQAAAKNGLLEIVDLLLAAGADVGLKAGNGKTAYDLAVESGQHAAAAKVKPST